MTMVIGQRHKHGVSETFNGECKTTLEQDIFDFQW